MATESSGKNNEGKKVFVVVCLWVWIAKLYMYLMYVPAEFREQLL